MQKGEPHLTDFGLARLVETESTVTRTLEVLGTPSYMAPEQAVGNNAARQQRHRCVWTWRSALPIANRSSAFCWGNNLRDDQAYCWIPSRDNRASWNPKIDRDLSTICLKCLEKDPKRRYSSALALAEDFERWLKHEPILARHTGIFTPGQKMGAAKSNQRATGSVAGRARGSCGLDRLEK